MKHLVDVDWLAKRLNRDDVVVVDASAMGSANQAEGIPGAIRFDLDSALSRGIHDMLPPRQFERELRNLGLRAGDRVVAYDADGIFSSARAWWMLRAAGIHAAVLDGGLPAWREAGHETGPVAESLGRDGDVEVRWESTRFRNARFVERRIQAGDPVLDARSAERFTGAAPDPREGVRAGHIPGAQNVPFTELLVNGHMRPVVELKARLAEHIDYSEQPLTASCGSGITACIIALAATLAGHKHVSIYDGSWADWGAENSGRPVATGAA